MNQPAPGFIESNPVTEHGPYLSFTQRAHAKLLSHGWLHTGQGWTRAGVTGRISINAAAGDGTWCHEYSVDEVRIGSSAKSLDEYLKSLVPTPVAAPDDGLVLSQDYADDTMTVWYVSHKTYGLVARIEQPKPIVLDGSRTYWTAELDNDCIGFGDRKSFFSEKAARMWVATFCLELEATGH